MVVPLHTFAKVSDDLPGIGDNLNLTPHFQKSYFLISYHKVLIINLVSQETSRHAWNLNMYSQTWQ